MASLCCQCHKGVSRREWTIDHKETACPHCQRRHLRGELLRSKAFLQLAALPRHASRTDSGNSHALTVRNRSPLALTGAALQLLLAVTMLTMCSWALVAKARTDPSPFIMLPLFPMFAWVLWKGVSTPFQRFEFRIHDGRLDMFWGIGNSGTDTWMPITHILHVVRPLRKRHQLRIVTPSEVYDIPACVTDSALIQAWLRVHLRGQPNSPAR